MAGSWTGAGSGPNGPLARTSQNTLHFGELHFR